MAEELSKQQSQYVVDDESDSDDDDGIMTSRSGAESAGGGARRGMHLASVSRDPTPGGMNTKSGDARQALR